MSKFIISAAHYKEAKWQSAIPL